MSKYSRSGGKFTGNHTTLTPATSLIADIVKKCEHVTKISPGFLKMGLKPIRGQRRVKIIDEPGRILLAVRDNASQQELHVYSNNHQEAKLAIARGVRNAGFGVSFEDRTKL